METKNRLILPLTGARPVRIDTDEWPKIAHAESHSGAHEFQANEVAYLSVRQHADGRAIVYGGRERGPGGMPIGYEGVRFGELVPAGGEIAAVVRRVGDDIAFRSLTADCLAALPAEEL